VSLLSIVAKTSYRAGRLYGAAKYSSTGEELREAVGHCGDMFAVGVMVAERNAEVRKLKSIPFADVKVA